MQITTWNEVTQVHNVSQYLEIMWSRLNNRTTAWIGVHVTYKNQHIMGKVKAAYVLHGKEHSDHQGRKCVRQTWTIRIAHTNSCQPQKQIVCLTLSCPYFDLLHRNDSVIPHHLSWFASPTNEGWVSMKETHSTCFSLSLSKKKKERKKGTIKDKINFNLPMALRRKSHLVAQSVLDLPNWRVHLTKRDEDEIWVQYYLEE